MNRYIYYIATTGKRIVFATAVLGTLVGFSASSNAAIIADDEFTYSVGELNGQNGGTGWSGSWTGVTSLTEVVDPVAPLSYSAPGINLNGGNRALQVTGNNNNAVSRTLGSAQSGDNVFVSFLIRTTGSIAGNDFASFWFDNLATGTHFAVPNIGIKADGSGPLDFAARLVLGSEVYSTASVSGTNYLVVGQLSKSVSGAGNNYDRFALWVNPTAGDINTPDAVATLGLGISSFNTLGLRTGNLDAGDSVLFDHFRLTTTYNEAVDAVPEPGSMMLLGGAGAFLMLFGRRRIVRG